MDIGVHAKSHAAALFPHLSRPRRLQFCWSITAGVAVVTALGWTGLAGAATLAAAVLLPAAYLAYLYDGRVYRDRPVRVLALTAVAGAILALVVTAGSDALLPAATPLQLGEGTGYLLGWAVVVPLVQEVVKLLPVLLLRNSGVFPATGDGVAFGAATGLWFAAAETLARYSPVLTGTPTATDWPAALVGLALLAPLLQAACTGLAAAALWRPRLLASQPYRAALPFALGAHVAFSLGTALLHEASLAAGYVLVFQALVVVAVLTYLRRLLAAAVPEEASCVHRAPLGHRSAAAWSQSARRVDATQGTYRA